jgi:hypothetical protein
MLHARSLAFGLALLGCTAVKADLVHRYSFTSDASDSVGGAHGTVVDAGAPTAVFGGGRLDLSGNNGQGSNAITEDAYVNLPNGIITSAVTGGVPGQLTLEIWAQSAVNRNWAALFSAGTSNSGEDTSTGGNASDYIQIIPQNGANQRIRTTTHRMNVGAEGFVDHTSPLSTTQAQHVVTVYDQSAGLPGTVTLYVDGALVGSAPVAAGFNIGAMPDVNNWLGRSQWNDPIFDGIYDEVRIYDSALGPGAVATNFALGPNVVPEPAGVAPLAIAGGALALRRRVRSRAERKS